MEREKTTHEGKAREERVERRGEEWESERVSIQWNEIQWRVRVEIVVMMMMIGDYTVSQATAIAYACFYALCLACLSCLSHP